MNIYKVTFVSDYFVLSTTVDSHSTDDEVIAEEANDFMQEWVGFSPAKFCYDVEIEEVCYA